MFKNTKKLSSIILPKLRGLVKSEVVPSKSLAQQKTEEEPASISPSDTPPKKKRDSWLRYFLVTRAGHLKYGLYTEDLIDEDIEVVKVALKRIPPEVMDARIFRAVRAMQLYINGEILPKDQWITYEEDMEYRYLTPYIRDVEKEFQEKRDFGDILEYEQEPNFS